MIHDIYNVLPTDLNYRMQLETTDEITHILEQIKMILGTKPGEVLGSPNYGVNLEQYLFNLSYNQEEMQKKIQAAISENISYDTTKYQIEVEINFGKDYVNSSDYALVDITINQIKCLGIVVTQ